MSQMGGSVSETSCFTEAAGQGRTSLFSHRRAQGWEDCVWMQAVVWPERLSAAEQSLKTPSPSPAAQERGDEAVLNPQRYRPVRSPVPHQLLHPSLADSPGPWSHPRGTRLARAKHIPTVG